MGKVRSSARHPASEAKSLARDFAKKASVRIWPNRWLTSVASYLFNYWNYSPRKKMTTLTLTLAHFPGKQRIRTEFCPGGVFRGCGLIREFYRGGTGLAGRKTDRRERALSLAPHPATRAGVYCIAPDSAEYEIGFGGGRE
jgi:hypothetical protein